MNKYSLQFKITIFFVCLTVLACIGGGFAAYQTTYSLMLEDRKIAIKDIVTANYKIIEKNYKDFKDGKVTENQAKKNSLANLRAVRFGEGDSDYLFIHGTNLHAIMLPPKPSVEGKDLSNLKDKYGTYIIKAVADAGAKGGDFFFYYWPSKADAKVYVPKLSYATRFKPWDWNLGTGIYIEEIKTSSINEAILLVVLIAVSALVCMALTLLYLKKYVVDQVGKASSGIADISSLVDNQAKQLEEASSALAESNLEQASSLEETSASLEELTQVINNNTQSAQGTAELASEVKAISNEASQSVTLMQGFMDEILAGNVEIQKLVEVIEEIAEKTKVMDEIVFQTKLLSFNASVEAERAGEHGRGFAVVAQEVGNLAQMSGNSAREIAEIVSGSIEQVRAITSSNGKKVENGNSQLQDTSQKLEKIVSAIVDINSNTHDIAGASKEQSLGIGQINDAVTQIDQAVQSNSNLSNTTVNIAKDLVDQSNDLVTYTNDLNDLLYGQK